MDISIIPVITTVSPIFVIVIQLLILFTFSQSSVNAIVRVHFQHAFMISNSNKMILVQPKNFMISKSIAGTLLTPVLQSKTSNSDESQRPHIPITGENVSFNPFQYDASAVRNTVMNDGTSIWVTPNMTTTTTTMMSTDRNNIANNNHIISLRSIQMKQIMNEMLNAVPDGDKINTILLNNQEFLLEPLNDDHAVQDDIDSIYTKCKNRFERFQTFQQTMNERILKVNDQSVKFVLTIYKDFILSQQ
jgi:hypothetical protein